MVSGCVIAIDGEQGSGKSTAVKKWLTTRGGGAAQRVPNQPARHVVASARGGGETVVVLGDYSQEDQPFPGTDRLQRHIQPAAQDVISKMTAAGTNVVFEGNLLFNYKMKDYLESAGIPHIFVVLEVPSHVASQNRTRRGVEQSHASLKRKATKLTNMKKKFDIHTVNPSQLETLLSIL